MRTRRVFALKTRWTIIAVFIVVFALGVGLSYWFQNGGQAAFAAVLSFSLLTAFLLVFFLSRTILQPIRALAKYARKWQLGQPWQFEVSTVIPEIDGLFKRMKELMESLNEKFRKAVERDRLKSKLVTMVSHELTNAISVIHAASVTLYMTEPEPRNKKRDRMFRMIKAQSLSISTTVSNLLSVDRLRSGKLVFARTRIDLRTLLLKNIDMMDILFENKELQVSTRFPDVVTPVYADPDAMTLVVTNLISNAIKFTPEGGTITVGLRRDDNFPGYLRVFVEDTGIGIDPEERHKIFSGYYRSERGKPHSKGFGIGLSLVKTIIEAHGGRLELESTPGRGSTFSFLMPTHVKGRFASKSKKKIAPKQKKAPT